MKKVYVILNLRWVYGVTGAALFLAIAREENFTRAAEQLHVTQPTLSRQIADLEQELGVKLFTRSNHHIVLTEDGMILNAGRRKFYRWRIRQSGTSFGGTKI